MSNGDLQNLLIGSVINGQHDVNRWNFDIADDAIPRDIQQLFTVFPLLLTGLETVWIALQGGVIRLRLLPHLALIHI